MKQTDLQLALSRPTARVLTWGFRASGALLLLGIAMTALQGDSLDTSLDSIPRLIERTLDGDGAGVVGLGILVMIVTPIVSTMSVVFSCLSLDDRRYAAITAAVLGILFVSAAVAAL